MPELELRCPIRWSPKQWHAISFRPPPSPDDRPAIEKCGLVGEYGGGKTLAAGCRCTIVALENPYDPRVHTPGSPPMSAIVVPTMATLHATTLPELRKTLLPELIARERLNPPHQYIELINGHMLLFFTALGVTEGLSVCQLWADECQRPEYVGQWENYLKRVRDGRARRLNFQVSGLAQHGPIEQMWRYPIAPYQRTVMFRTTDNRSDNLASGYVGVRLGLAPSTEVKRDATGWTLAGGLLYEGFSDASFEHGPLDRRRPVSLGVDLRTHAAVVITQDIRIKVVDEHGRQSEADGLLAVDQLVPEHQSAETIARAVADRGWLLEPGKSVIAMDPTAALDEVNAFANRFPRVQIVQAKGGPYYRAENGERCLARSLRDGLGNMRLRVHASLASSGVDAKGVPRGVVQSFRGYSEKKKKDGIFEHMADACRYINAAKLPLPDLEQPTPKPRPDVGHKPAWTPAY